MSTIATDTSRNAFEPMGPRFAQPFWRKRTWRFWDRDLEICDRVWAVYSSIVSPRIESISERAFKSYLSQKQRQTDRTRESDGFSDLKWAMIFHHKTLDLTGSSRWSHPQRWTTKTGIASNHRCIRLWRQGGFAIRLASITMAHSDQSNEVCLTKWAPNPVRFKSIPDGPVFHRAFPRTFGSSFAFVVNSTVIESGWWGRSTFCVCPRAVLRWWVRSRVRYSWQQCRVIGDRLSFVNSLGKCGTQVSFAGLREGGDYCASVKVHIWKAEEFPFLELLLGDSQICQKYCLIQGKSSSITLE
jgi:hypothetical protein